MLNYIIDRADQVEIGDIIVTVVGNESLPRDARSIGRVMRITRRHHLYDSDEYYLRLEMDYLVKPEDYGKYTLPDRSSVMLQSNLRVAIIREAGVDYGPYKNIDGGE
jgi:hypothetical protein